MQTLVHDIRQRFHEATAILVEAQHMLGRLDASDAAALAAMGAEDESEVAATIAEAKKSLKKTLTELGLTDLALYLVVDVDGDDDPDEEAA